MFNLIEIVGCEQAELGIFCIAEEILQERNVLDRLGANGLTYEKVGSDLLSVVVKKDSSFAQKTSISLSTILKHPLVVYAASEEHCWHRMLFKKYVDEPHFICTNSYVFLKDLLEKKGYFMFLLNRKFHKIDAIDTLTVIPVKENIKVTIGVLFKKDTDHSIFSQRFIASMKAYLQSL